MPNKNKGVSYDTKVVTKKSNPNAARTGTTGAAYQDRKAKNKAAHDKKYDKSSTSSRAADRNASNSAPKATTKYDPAKAAAAKAKKKNGSGFSGAYGGKK